MSVSSIERVVPNVDGPLAELDEMVGVDRGAIGMPTHDLEFELSIRLADHECKHGRLPGDRTRPCGCWSQEPAPPAPAITKEDAVELATGNATSATPDEEAPFGRFRNGKPRKSPAGSAARRNTPLRAAPEPAVTPDDAAELRPTEQILADLYGLREDAKRNLAAIEGAIEALKMVPR